MSDRRVEIPPELVARARATDIVALAERLVPGGKRRGREVWACCPFHHETTPSFHAKAPARGDPFYHCFGCGAHGDAIDLAMALQGWGFVEAVAELTGTPVADVRPKGDWRSARPARWRDDDARRRAAEIEDKRRAERVDGIWRRSQPAAGTPVEGYLTGRGLDLAWIGWPIADLRFVPDLEYFEPAADAVDPETGELTRRPARDLGRHPAMVAAMRDRQGRLRAVHCTYLALGAGPGDAGVAVAKLDLGVNPDDGKPRPAKKMQGTAWGTSIRLSALPANGVWMPAEGIETALSGLMAERWAGRDACVEAAGSLPNLAGIGAGRGPKHPFRRDKTTNKPLRMPSAEPDMDRPGIQAPQGARVARPLFDGNSLKDAPSQLQLEARACERWRRENLRVQPPGKPPPGLDYNDLLTGKAAAGGAKGGHHASTSSAQAQDTMAPRRAG